MLDAAAISKDGYIINQSKISAIPYGAYPSSVNGCGWIAAFNLLRLNGSEISWHQVREALEKRLWFKGRFGTAAFTLHKYLRSKGYAFRRAFTKRQMMNAARDGGTGLLLYYTGKGVHFVAFGSVDTERIRFFNARLGDAQHVESMRCFLETYVKMPFIYGLIVKTD